MAKRCMSPKAAKWVIGIFSIFLAISLAALIIFPSLYEKILKKEVSLDKSSLSTTIWKDIPLPIYEKLYFFNIINGDKFLKNEEPLNVTEVGPYTYRGKWVKPDPIWNPNGTISYHETRTWQFVPEMSVGSQDDIINTLNGPMIIGANILKDYDLAMRLIYCIAMKFEKESIITKKKIRELVYDGYKDPIIEYAPILKPNLPYKNGVFSWLYGKNATNDGLFTVFDGVEDPLLKNVVYSWNGNEKLSFWKDDTCNAINGTNIEMGPPQPDAPESYAFFQSIFCRSMTLNYTGDQTPYGILAKRFESNRMWYANSTENPDNACFEVSGERPSGVLDISPCEFGAPVFISNPHFHMADPFYLKNIVGLRPMPDHGSYLDAEQITGVTINISMKFQINLEMERVFGVLQFNNVPEGIFPVLWADISIQLTEEWANFLKSQLDNPKIIGYSVLGTVAIVSFVLITVGFVYLYLGKKDNQNEPLIESKEDRKKKMSNQEYMKQNESSTNYGGLTNNSMDQHSNSNSMTSKNSHIQEYPSIPNDF